ncbi:MAG: T9SS type A sorting domain-containing protein [Bacteroidetes bacterium]|nr:T9SS type A sorting domain-containing protein [Bacteroidota bacterium]
MISDQQSGVIIAAANRIFRYDSNGSKKWSDSGIYIPRYIYSLNLSYDMQDLICSSIEYIGMTMFSNYYLTSLHLSGDVKWERKILDSINLDIEKPKFIIGELEDINLFWNEQVSDTNYCINYLKVDNLGNITFSVPQKIIRKNITIIGDPEPILSDSHSIILIWGQPDIYYYALRIDSNGNSLWNEPLLINANKTFDFIHTVAQGTEGIILIWYEVAVRSGIYAQNVNKEGILGPLTSIGKKFQSQNSPMDSLFVRNYPNPFNSNTQIVFNLPRGGDIEISVYDILGREISHRKNYFTHGGVYSSNFNAERLNSGVYLYSIMYEGKLRVYKMQLLK